MASAARLTAEARRAIIKKRAKKFSTGTYTALDTGARQQAQQDYEDMMGIRNAQDIASALLDTGSWENLIGGGQPK